MDPRPSPAASQGRTFLELFASLRPFLTHDRNLPTRIQQRLAREKRFGSRDRRLYRELLYTAVRYLPWIDARLAISPDEGIRATAWLAADTAATHLFRAHWTAGMPDVPVTLADKAAQFNADPAALIPSWLGEHCPAAVVSPEVDVLHTRAPLWLRLQTDDVDAVLAEFTARNWEVRPSGVLPSALEVLTEADVTGSDAFARGLIEVQDLGSQLLLAELGLPLSGHWLDACAGAGGKTLQLARLLAASGGRVDAHDIRANALDELGSRAARARIANIRILPSTPTASYDGVLVDAPCSGLGTWRRSPHLKWTTTPATIESSARLQKEIINRYAALVRPGGLLIYATCSLSHHENEDIVTAFLGSHPEFSSAAPARTLLPSQYNTDGYFVAALRRAAG